jgi:hypothetical protein
MFRSLPFITMRQKQGESIQTIPFGFAGSDELINHDLRAIDEIAELRFPDHQLIGRRTGITIFESKHGFFRKQRIDRPGNWPARESDVAAE